MKFIPLGLHCSVPEGIKEAGFRAKSYPFDWLWTPSKTVRQILEILINQGIDSAIEYMTNDYSYFKWMENENYESITEIGEAQMNIKTGLGISHYVIDQKYKQTLHRRLTRLLDDLRSDQKIVLIYADAASPEKNYCLNNIIYGKDATIDLLKIYLLLYQIIPLGILNGTLF